jgi:CheY-like chemotaxis protein
MMRKVRILVVEDNRADAELLSEFITEASADTVITIADDGQRAAEIFQAMAESGEGAPDLVLVDLNLPKRSGHEVLEMIRGMDGKVKILICSGSGSPTDTEMAKGKADGYIIKPMTVSEIDAMVARLRDIINALR